MDSGLPCNETERKFIVVNDSWKAFAHPDRREHLLQGYITQKTAEVWLHTGKSPWISVTQKPINHAKKPVTPMQHWNCDITAEQAQDILSLCPSVRKHSSLAGHRQSSMKANIMDNGGNVRIRISTNSLGQQHAELTIKGKRKLVCIPLAAEKKKEVPKAISRPEKNVLLGVGDAQDMLATVCAGTIAKDRDTIQVGEREWCIDSFTDPKYHGLVMAETEFENGQSIRIALPNYVHVKSEVTEKPLFSNRSLAMAGPAQLSLLKREMDRMLGAAMHK